MAVPKIRIKGYTDEWNNSTVGNVANVVGGGTPSTYDNMYWGGSIQWFTPSEIGKDKYVLKSERSITKVGLEHSSAKLIPANSILLTSRATIGEMSINLCECATNQGFQSLIPNGVNLDFLYALMKTKQNTLIRESSGSTFLEISANKVRSIEISIPDSLEQEAIGSYFQSLDLLIEATGKKIATLKQTKQASLQSMFPQEGETKPRVRFKGFTDDWKKIEIGKYGDTYSGLSGKSKDDFGKGDAKYITFLNVLANAQINTSVLESVDVKTGERQNAVQKGDILFNTSSETPEEVGLCSVLLEDIPNVYLNSFCFGFRPNNPTINSEFMVYLMRGHIGRSIMKVLAQGATRYNLSKKRLCETLIPIPTNIDEQKQISEYFSNLDKQISIQEQRLEKLKQIKCACLKNMFV